MQEALAAGVDYVVVVTQDTHLEPGVLARARRRRRVAIPRPAPCSRSSCAARPTAVSSSTRGATSCTTSAWASWAATASPTARSTWSRSPTRAVPACSIARARCARWALRSRAVHVPRGLGSRLAAAAGRLGVLLAPAAVMHHDYDFARTAWTRKSYYVERNRLINVLTHYPPPRSPCSRRPCSPSSRWGCSTRCGAAGWRERLAVYGFFARPSTWRYLRRQAPRGSGAAPAARSRGWCPGFGAFTFGPVATPAVRCVLDPIFAAYWSVVRRLIVW